MTMGRRQRGIRILWRICWERDFWHRVPSGIKRMANKRWRKQLKEQLRDEPIDAPTDTEFILTGEE